MCRGRGGRGPDKLSEWGRVLLRMSPRVHTMMRTLLSLLLREEICMVEGLASMEVGDRNCRAVRIPSDLTQETAHTYA